VRSAHLAHLVRLALVVADSYLEPILLILFVRIVRTKLIWDQLTIYLHRYVKISGSHY
jgi:hypothetical protein